MARGPVYRRTIKKPVQNVQDCEKTAWDILEVLNTPIGARPNLPTFGSKLHMLKFELATDFMLDLSKIFITESISNSMPQVSIKRISAARGDTPKEIKFQILFVDRTVNLEGSMNMVFNNGVFNI